VWWVKRTVAVVSVVTRADLYEARKGLLGMTPLHG
jgi:hypothetical protein